ncbi:MAG: single-stranded DNA-binding protein [Lachnospiraceae bacterium]|nr:single-stranded DNA-binding protein [Lachnospiraceae bacterium]
MKRKDTIGIVGRIAVQPKMVIDAEDWAQKVYETVLTRKRPSGAEDTFILQFNGRAAGSVDMLEKITEGTEVLVGGEIRTQNVYKPKPEENSVKTYIYAEVIKENMPPVKNQNEVELSGTICKEPHIKTVRSRTQDGKRLACASIMVAVNTQSGTYYIPCVCWDWAAYSAKILKVGECVKVYGRFQSRKFKKRIDGREIPFLCTTYEVCVINIESMDGKQEKGKGRRGK